MYKSQNLRIFDNVIIYFSLYNAIAKHNLILQRTKLIKNETEKTIGKEMIRKLIEQEKLEEVKKYWKTISKKELEVDLFWDPTLNDAPTRFEITRSDRIFLNENCDVKELVPAIVRENIHRKQFKRYGWIMYSFLKRFDLLSLDFFAKRAGRRAERIISITG